MILFPIFIGKIAVRKPIELKETSQLLIWEDRKFADWKYWWKRQIRD